MKKDEERDAASKELLQRRMEETQDSIEATVSEIKETVEDRVRVVKKTLGGVAEWRQQFGKEPVVWSLGTLAAGFALGYTLGYAHKNARKKSDKRTEIGTFVDDIVAELSDVGNDLIMPRLNRNISRLFGIDFSSVLEEMKKSRTSPSARRSLPAAHRTSGAARRTSGAARRTSHLPRAAKTRKSKPR